MLKLLVLYSTFLTKSGILGDTSVHSFVDSGILPQLLVYLLSFLALGHLMLLRPGVWRNRALIAIGILVIICLKGYVIEALTGFLLVLVAAAVKAYRKDIERTEEEDSIWSRDFWMFVG